MEIISLITLTSSYTGQNARNHQEHIQEFLNILQGNLAYDVGEEKMYIIRSAQKDLANFNSIYCQFSKTSFVNISLTGICLTNLTN